LSGGQSGRERGQLDDSEKGVRNLPHGQSRPYVKICHLFKSYINILAEKNVNLE
jgi:hypothetical protein